MSVGRHKARVAAVAVLALLAATATHAAGAVRADRTPPAFAGLKSATTCIPGPVGGDRTARYRLVWAVAKDDVTRAAGMIYDVYQAASAGGERFSKASYTTRRGATTFVTPPLPTTQTYYFVVRARDAAGNRDRNRRERPGVNLCL
jgi:hypothetical protein